LWQVTDVDKLLFEMPGSKTLFKKDWLLHTDGEGYKISSWCQPRKWERRIALFARKRSCATIKDSHSYFSMLEAKVTKH